MIEALVSLALILAILGAFGGLFSSFGNVNRRIRDKDKVLEAALHGLSRMAGELKTATAINLPSGGLSPILRFERIDPSASYLPATPSPSLPTPFNPYPANTITIEYRVDGDVLIRETTRPGGPTVTEELVYGLVGLGATDVETDRISLTLSVDDNGKLRRLSREVFLAMRL